MDGPVTEDLTLIASLRPGDPCPAPFSSRSRFYWCRGVRPELSIRSGRDVVNSVPDGSPIEGAAIHRNMWGEKSDPR